LFGALNYVSQRSQKYSFVVGDLSPKTGERPFVVGDLSPHTLY